MFFLCTVWSRSPADVSACAARCGTHSRELTVRGAQALVRTRNASIDAAAAAAG
ncbi:MAG TPA: hypothetical protein VHU91_04895 [Mycobacteriales bacterium]|nr:hypothetical protein [Mycobacteriales bacterium]